MINNKEGLELDLQKLLMSYLRKWWLIAASILLVGAMAWFITANLITPMYKASVTVYVNNVASGQQVDTISSGNLSTSQRLVNTYINMIESDTVLEKVAETSALNITADYIRNVMSAEQVDDTELFKVYITNPDPAMAAKIANAIAEVAPGEIERFVEGSSTKIIDYAKAPSYPASPSVNRNVFLGALVGCALAIAYLTIVFLLDVRIKDEEDLTMLFELPVLVQIPTFGTSGDKSAYKDGGYARRTAAEKGGADK